jgi:hypothetical protein
MAATIQIFARQIPVLAEGFSGIHGNRKFLFLTFKQSSGSIDTGRLR